MCGGGSSPSLSLCCRLIIFFLLIRPFVPAAIVSALLWDGVSRLLTVSRRAPVFSSALIYRAPQVYCFLLAIVVSRMGRTRLSLSLSLCAARK